MTDAVVKYEAKKAVATRSTLKALLEARQESFSSVIARHLTPEKLIKMALIATARNPKLLQCSQESILEAIMTGAQLGLDFSGVLGRAYLIPYGSEAKFMIGYLGLIDLCRNSGDVRSVSADVVYKQDTFIYKKGLEEELSHIPNYEAPRDDDDIVGAYMIARFKDGGHHIDFMSRAEIEKARKSSRAQSGPWFTHYSEMCKKTAIRHGCKLLPLSIETQEAIAQDQEIEFKNAAYQPAVATISLADIQPGDPEDHTDVSVRLSVDMPTGLNLEFPSAVGKQTGTDLWKAFLKGHPSLTKKGQLFAVNLISQKWGVPEELTAPEKLVKFQAWLDSDLVTELQQENFLPMERQE